MAGQDVLSDTSGTRFVLGDWLTVAAFVRGFSEIVDEVLFFFSLSRYGLIAQDLDSDKKGHECFRFPSACLCQLIVGDTSPVPEKDSVASTVA